MKTAVITAASRGIGRGVARMLAQRGYRVIASYAHNEQAAHEAKQELGPDTLYFQADHSDRTQTYRFIDFIRQHTDRIDCVVCNAGITIRHSFTETTDSDWDAMMEVGVNAHMILLRELMPLIQPNSRILFTGSAMGCHPHATILGYGVMKGAVHAMMKNLVKVFEPLQTTVNAIAPGFVETDWQKEKPEHIRQNIYQKTAIHRFSSIEETVQAYVFCIDNPFVNGAVINVDGGYNYR